MQPPMHRVAPQRHKSPYAAGQPPAHITGSGDVIRILMPHPATSSQQMRLSIAERLEPQLQVARRQNLRYREQLKVLARQNRAMSLALSRFKAQQRQQALTELEGDDANGDAADMAGILEASVEEERHRRQAARELRPATAALHKIYATGAEVRAATAGGGGYSSEFSRLEAANAAAVADGQQSPLLRAHRQPPRIPGQAPRGAGGAGPQAAAAGSGISAVATLASSATAPASTTLLSGGAGLHDEGLVPTTPTRAAAKALSESERAREALQVLVQGLEAELAMVREQLGTSQSALQAAQAAAKAAQAEARAAHAEARASQAEASAVRAEASASLAGASAAETASDEMSACAGAAGGAAGAASGDAGEQTAAEGHTPRIAQVQAEAEARVARVEAASREAVAGLQGQVEALTNKCIAAASERASLLERAEAAERLLAEAEANKRVEAMTRVSGEAQLQQQMRTMKHQLDQAHTGQARPGEEPSAEARRASEAAAAGELLVPWAAALEALRARTQSQTHPIEAEGDATSLS